MRRHWSAAAAALLIGVVALPGPASGQAVNRAPVARTDHLTGHTDTPLIVLYGRLLSNDSPGRGEHGQRLRVIGVADDPESPGHVFITGGHAVFVPASGFDGTARFRYTIRDSGGRTDTGTVRVTVSD
jgi:hypothetical protein